ncbi:MAG: 5-formyltetrahydrofolate cyclo-ligase [Deltaproteobacteria bacterium]|nr:5-formyltetrahydrofolate cyclo-ligase [Deltaproteobacteria bacterium]
MLVFERKATLRQARRDSVRAGSSSRASGRAQANFLREFPPRRGAAVALYNAVRGEVGTDAIRSAYLEAGAVLYYPRIGSKGKLVFLRHRDGDPWEEGPYGIPEPPRAPGRRPRTTGFDLIVVPGVAFDRAGRRLGHGFGYYDRFLGGLPEGVPRVGLAYASQLVPEVPVDAWDVPVHALVTEEGVIRVRQGTGSPKK